MLYGFKLVSKPNAGQEIRQILKDYPTARIAMGYGDADDYADERLSYRPLLFPTTGDNPMNAVSMVEFICSNKPIPSSAVARFREEAYDIFLIPSGGAPFSAEIFQGLEVQEQFSSHYERLEQREFFEIWRRKSLRN